MNFSSVAPSVIHKLYIPSACFLRFSAVSYVSRVNVIYLKSTLFRSSNFLSIKKSTIALDVSLSLISVISPYYLSFEYTHSCKDTFKLFFDSENEGSKFSSLYASL